MQSRMASPDSSASRLPPILERLVERTEAEEIEWDVAAVPDGYAVTVGDVRFRVRSVSGDGQPPYVLEFLLSAPFSMPSVITGHNENVDALLGQLYSVARRSAVGEVADPFDLVEQALGLAQASDDPDTA